MRPLFTRPSLATIFDVTIEWMHHERRSFRGRRSRAALCGLRSEGGIAFAVLLMLIQIGFYNAFLDSALAIPRRLDGEVFLISTAMRIPRMIIRITTTTLTNIMTTVIYTITTHRLTIYR